MNEYENVNGLWVPKYVQRNGVWVKREEAAVQANDWATLLRVTRVGPIYWFEGPDAFGYLPYRETEEEAAVAEVEALLKGAN